VTTTRLVLGSASPRRRELLAALGAPFDVLPAGVDESLPATIDPEHGVALLAWRKAAAIAELRPDAVVLAADTLVLLDGLMLGKPADAAEARTFLTALCGRTHRVLTAVSLFGSRVDACVVSTAVTMRRYASSEIEAWVDGGAAYDKAGGYAIQDEGLRPVASYSGCYCNVLGLPLWDVWRMLRGLAGVGELRRPDETIAICRNCPRALPAASA